MKLKPRRIKILQRRYGNLTNCELICKAGAEMLAGQTMEDIRADMEGIVSTEWEAIKLAILLAVAEQLDDEGQ